MKKTFLTLAIIAISQFSYAQWTGTTDIYNTNSGNVGIGTTSPTSALDIGGQLQLSGINSSTPPTGLSYGLFPYGGVGLGLFSGATAASQGIGIWTNPSGVKTEVMRILSGGNVGIGTTSPNVPLHVARYGNNVTGNMTLLTTFTDPTGIKGISLGYNQSSQAGIIYSENNTGVGSPLEFWTYNGSSFAPRMVFVQSGNLGIGTTSPMATLDIANGNYMGSLALNIGADISASTRTTNTRKVAVITAPTYANTTLTTAVNTDADYNYNAVNFGGGNASTYAATGLHFFTAANTSTISGTERFTINSSGNVGIGTTSPGSALTIRGSGTGVSIHPIGSGYFGSLAFNRESATGAIFNASGNAFQINNGGPDANLHFQVYNGSGSNITGDALVISGSDGSVGINTASTHGYQFAVNGSAIATSVTVKLYADWPDYVLKKTYKLPSLLEVKSYINKNKHLPDMPSEQEVAKEGINLGEMNKLLTKKVEELTLYLIEQNRQLTDQQKKFKQQDEKIEALENVLSKVTNKVARNIGK